MQVNNDNFYSFNVINPILKPPQIIYFPSPHNLHYMTQAVDIDETWWALKFIVSLLFFFFEKLGVTFIYQTRHMWQTGQSGKKSPAWNTWKSISWGKYFEFIKKQILIQYKYKYFKTLVVTLGIFYSLRLSISQNQNTE